jgi:hypothetical protein
MRHNVEIKIYDALSCLKFFYQMVYSKKSNKESYPNPKVPTTVCNTPFSYLSSSAKKESRVHIEF